MPRESDWENTEIPEQKKVKNSRPPGATQNTKASQAHMSSPRHENSKQLQITNKSV